MKHFEMYQNKFDFYKQEKEKIMKKLSESLRDCFLTHHEGHNEHEGWTFDGQNSCPFVKFVAKNGLKGILARLQRT